MELYIKRKLQSDTSWECKRDAVILTNDAKNIDLIWEYLVAQDDYWTSYKDLIQVCDPLQTFRSAHELERMCKHCGKTDIYDIPAFTEFCKIKNIGIFIYQSVDEYFY